jgi:hypothetical protein
MEPIPGVLFEDRAPPSLRDDEFDAQLRAMQARSRRRNVMIAILAMMLVGVLALVGIGYVGLMSLDDGGGTETATGRGEDGGLVAKDAAPAPSPVVAPPPTPEPAPVEPAKAEPAPEPAKAEPAKAEPAPEPAKAAPKPPPAKRPKPLIDQGWNTVEGNPSKALDLFAQAKSLGGGAEASYGQGYALEKLGRKDEATTAYCGAIKAGDESLKREVRSVMERQGLACP